KDLVDGPIVTAGAEHAGHVPGFDDVRLGDRNEEAIQLALGNFEVAQHPLALFAAAAEAPATTHHVTAFDSLASPAAGRGGTRDDVVRSGGEDFAYALVWQAQGDQLLDAIVGQVPADGAIRSGDELGDAEERRKVDL